MDGAEIEKMLAELPCRHFFVAQKLKDFPPRRVGECFEDGVDH